MRLPSVSICSCFIPAVVTDGVPIRTPDVMKGDRGSLGMELRLSVIPASSRTVAASLPVSSSSMERRSTENM